jgi:uncharacterized membrane protein HdeD (DUF308 family)
MGIVATIVVGWLIFVVGAIVIQHKFEPKETEYNKQRRGV